VARSILPHQLRQLGDVHGDAPRLILGEQLGRRSSPRLILEIDIREARPILRRTRVEGNGAQTTALLFLLFEEFFIELFERVVK
jgi:hypothetical protein